MRYFTCSTGKRTLLSGNTGGQVYAYVLPDTTDTLHYVRDDRYKECMECGKAFSVLDRKTHCRTCGGKIILENVVRVDRWHLFVDIFLQDSFAQDVYRHRLSHCLIDQPDFVELAMHFYLPKQFKYTKMSLLNLFIFSVILMCSIDCWLK